MLAMLISEIVEVDAELGNPNCKLIKPYVYKVLMIWFLGKAGYYKSNRVYD